MIVEVNSNIVVTKAMFTDHCSVFPTDIHRIVIDEIIAKFPEYENAFNIHFRIMHCKVMKKRLQPINNCTCTSKCTFPRCKVIDDSVNI